MIIPQQRVAAQARIAINSNSLQGSDLICCSRGLLIEMKTSSEEKRSMMIEPSRRKDGHNI